MSGACSGELSRARDHGPLPWESRGYALALQSVLLTSLCKSSPGDPSGCFRLALFPSRCVKKLPCCTLHHCRGLPEPASDPSVSLRIISGAQASCSYAAPASRPTGGPPGFTRGFAASSRGPFPPPALLLLLAGVETKRWFTCPLQQPVGPSRLLPGSHRRLRI